MCILSMQHIFNMHLIFKMSAQKIKQLKLPFSEYHWSVSRALRSVLTLSII